MFAAFVLTIPALVVPLLEPPATRDCQFGRMGDPVADERALAVFADAVDRYAHLRFRLERGFPPVWALSDLEQREFAAEQLRAALRDARPTARAGDIFTAAVADALRFRIANALREHNYDLEAMTFATDEEGDLADFSPPIVNKPWPWGTPHVVWPAALKVLPQLPPGLEFRFVSRDLVLLDAHADLVVDILEFALPGMSAPATDHFGSY